MAHGVNAVLKRPCKLEGKTGIGSRRIFPPHFKLQVLDSYRNDADCKGNQRATARKYGIHRRQIQKWLQVENTLRNSVNKGKPMVVTSSQVGQQQQDSTLKSNDYGRQRGVDFEAQAAVRVVEARVPQISPVSEIVVPLDYTISSREHSSPIAGSPVPNLLPHLDPGAPMDLSVKRSPQTTTTRVPCHHDVYATPMLHHSPHAATPTTTLLQSPDSYSSPSPPDAWDLSTKSCKRKLHEDPQDSLISNPKPVKLFKPYLDDIQQDSSSSEDSSKNAEIISMNCCGYSCSPDYYNNNNNNIHNNNNSYDTYTLHELQPKSSSISHHYYYHPIATTYLYPSPDTCDIYYPLAYADEPLQPVKQRQTYSLDFKLSAIECYHQDEMCRGNQRAVASKYNIHRRQVQKWLQQEDDLRQRHETVKQIHVS